MRGERQHCIRGRYENPSLGVNIVPVMFLYTSVAVTTAEFYQVVARFLPITCADNFAFAASWKAESV